MSKSDPFLFRRGNAFAFRIAIPHDLRPVFGQREIVRSLRTSDRCIATPAALELAAAAKRHFYELRICLSKKDDPKLRELMKGWQHKFEIDQLQSQHVEEFERQRLNHLRELEKARLEAKVTAMEELLAGAHKMIIPTSVSVHENAPKAHVGTPAPMFESVVSVFLCRYAKTDSSSMLKKHRLVLPMLVEVVGDRPINELKQAHINYFFDVICNLPPRWKDVCRKQKLTVRQVSELEHEKTLAPKSFEDTYIASVRPFLKAAKKDWQDQGFPLGLTTDGMEYLGDREDDENKQRSFTLDELRTLFQGDAMRSIASNESQAHHFWLTHIGLFTGARVNEICQLNPQTDIVQDELSGVWYFWITKYTEADVGIVKSVKTGESRKVPIHNILIDLGLLEYVRYIKAAGAKRLFPAWEPINKRASGNAEKWFRQFLRDAELRDETPKRKILGMHAFRHTILTHGQMQEPKLNLTSITGHSQKIPGFEGAAKGYVDMELINTLTDLKVLIDKLKFDVDFYRPVCPTK